MWSQQLTLCALVILSALSACNGAKVLFCYWGSWSTYRPSFGAFSVDKIDPTLCTHYVYAFAGLTLSGNSVMTSADPYLDVNSCEGGGTGAKDSFRKFTSLRQKNPNAKFLLAVGGWNVGSTQFSNLSLTATGRQHFIASVVDYVVRFGFDGIDVDWEYPGSRPGSRPEDKQNFVLLLKELKAALSGIVRVPGLGVPIVTAAIPAAEQYLYLGYDLPEISKHLDYINVMAYDYHTISDGMYTYHHSALNARPDDNEVDKKKNWRSTLQYLQSSGVDLSKVTFGIETYGRTYQLANPAEHAYGSAITAVFPQGPYSGESGTMTYTEICEKLAEGAEEVFDYDVMAPYAHKDRFWACYDDPDSATEKALFIATENLAGAMIWSMEGDDFNQKCGEGPFPITTAVKNILDMFG